MILNLPDGDWTAIPSRHSYLVPLSLPSRMIRRPDYAQIQNLALDRIPLQPESLKLWVLLPRPGFFSRGTATVLVAGVPSKSVGADRSFPEDILLGALALGRRFSKGGVVALDAPGCLTVLGLSRGAKTIVVQKYFGDAETDPLQPFAPFFKKGAVLLRLAAGGAGESLLARYGSFASEPAEDLLANQAGALLSEKRLTLRPKLVDAPPVSDKDQAADASIKRAPRVGWRYGVLIASLILPLAGLGMMKTRFDRSTADMGLRMSESYERRFGAMVPDPLRAIMAKSETLSAQTRLPAVPLQAWLSASDRLSASAGSSSIKLDLVALDGVQVEVKGSAPDLESVARWVSGLSADPQLREASLVSSENRLIERRTTFLVRAKFKIAGAG